MHRKYIAFILSPLLLLALLVLSFGWRLQELKGDMTRVGGYSENDFGWNGLQKKFTASLAEEGVEGGSYDIIILGDSFSLRTSPDRQTQYGGFWTDFLAQKIDAKIGVFNVEPPKLEEFLQKETFTRHPPKLVILEYVERQLKNKFFSIGSECPSTQPELKTKLQLSLKTKNLEPVSEKRAAKTGWHDNLPGETIDYLWKNLYRKITNRDPSTIVKLPISKADLFTNLRSSEILLTDGDFLKKDWAPSDWQAIDCRLLQIQAAVESNSFTHFALIIAPDKSTAYSDFLAPSDRMPNSVEKIAQDPKLHLIRLDLPLKNAIQSGAKDVYLPNDTHWGSAGSVIVADEVLSFLKK